MNIKKKIQDAIITFQDDIEARNTKHGHMYQAVHPVSREGVGPLRETRALAESDDQIAFQNEEKKKMESKVKVKQPKSSKQSKTGEHGGDAGTVTDGNTSGS